MVHILCPLNKMGCCIISMPLVQGAIKLKQAIVQDAVQIFKMARTRVHFYEKKTTLGFNRVHFRKKPKVSEKNNYKQLKVLGFNNLK